MANLHPTVTDYYDSPMTDLTDGDYETLFAHLAEMGATCCRRKLPALRDDHIEALRIIIDELADTWRPELTAREWLAAVYDRLAVTP